MRTKFWYKFWDKGYSTKNWIFRQAVVASSLERLLQKTDAKGSTDRMFSRGGNMISTRENNDTVKQFVLSQEDARGGVA